MKNLVQTLNRQFPGIKQLARGFVSQRSGNVAIIFAFSVTIMAGLVALSLDYGNAYRIRQQMQAAADAAVLSAGSLAISDPSELEALTKKYFEANGGKVSALENLDVAVTMPENGVKIDVSGEMKTRFATILGQNQLGISVTAEAGLAGGEMEIALVLDNTGSMRDNMDDLKTAAKDLVDVIYSSTITPEAVKIAIVPYTGAVNIGTSANQMDWMDVAGIARHHGHWIEKYDIGYEPGCTDPTSGGPSDPEPGPGGGLGGTDRQGALKSNLRRFAQGAQELFGVSSAKAADASQVPAPFGFDEPCGIENPPSVNLFNLFNLIPNVSWKGCVEARAEPYDVNDTPPDSSDPDTLFVPFFWPDEPDENDDNGNPFPNNYLDDRGDLMPAPFVMSSRSYALRTIMKYNNTNADVATIAPATRGPNASCPDPILPLTNDKDTIVSTIDNLSHWNGGGTVSSEGVAWGWRVLSPEAPFTEGKSYSEATKYIVFMTDGMNMAAEQAYKATKTDFTAYGYLENGRVSPETFVAYKDHIDARMLLTCENAKDAGIIIYTITFGDQSDATKALYEQCATTPPYAYNASTTSDLKDAFSAIAGNISKLRLKY